MLAPIHPSLAAGQSLVRLVTTALTQTSRAGISEMLRVVAEVVNADGCILWQRNRSPQRATRSQSDTLSVLAAWYRDVTSYYSAHNVSLQTAIGYPIVHNTTVHVDDTATDNRIERTLPRHMQPLAIRCFFCVPVEFLKGRYGSLFVYRSSKNPFTSIEIQEVETLVLLWLNLYQTIVDKVSYQLVRKVNECLQDIARSKTDVIGEGRKFNTTAETICTEVRDTFQAVEVSLFLTDNPGPNAMYTLRTTTWPDDRIYRKKEYRASADDGLSGWILANRHEVTIFDLARFDREREELRDRYPGLVWEDHLDLAGSLRRSLAVPDERLLQPLSFMGVPILAAGRLLGVITCCTAKQNPYYFSEEDVGLLHLVANQIGQAWNTWLSYRDVEEENRSWQRFVTSMGKLNRFVREEVGKDNPREDKIFRSALKALSSIIEDSDILDVRLVDYNRRELYFAATRGKAWTQGTADEIAKRRNARFSLDGSPPTSGGAHVVQTKQVYVIEDTTNPAYYYASTFPDTRSLIIAPISIAGGEVLGVLDVRRTTTRPFRTNATAIAELLGEQVGLYHYLARTIAERQRERTLQIQTYQDFTHQLKTPVGQLHARLQEQVGQRSDATRDLLVLRGLSSKARRVCRSFRLFADLSSDKPLALRFVQLTDDYVVKSLIEAVVDQDTMLDPRRKLSFDVARDSFTGLREWFVEVDRDLFLQAVGILIDNAAKYSYDRTTIYVRGSLVDDGPFFQLSVISQGLLLTGDEIQKCTERGWRSPTAQAVTGEGAGIGLWIADHIMKAHKGELRIATVAQEHRTEVQLRFPIRSPGYIKGIRRW